jgi:hypothetical protein
LQDESHLGYGPDTCFRGLALSVIPKQPTEYAEY